MNVPTKEHDDLSPSPWAMGGAAAPSFDAGEAARQRWMRNRDEARPALQQLREHRAVMHDGAQQHLREQPFGSLFAAAALGAPMGGLAMLSARRPQ
jgi:hypothetical protein